MACVAFISLYLLAYLLSSIAVNYASVHTVTVSLTPLNAPYTPYTPYFTLPPLTHKPGECERFVTSLKTNRCLLELDLSENLIGTAEVRSVLVLSQ